MKQYEAQRVITTQNELEAAVASALREAETNTGVRMKLKGYREEERVDAHSGRKTILVYAQFTPMFAEDDGAAVALNPHNLNDSIQAAMPVTPDWANKDERFS
jgi:hypothetical protein